MSATTIPTTAGCGEVIPWHARAVAGPASWIHRKPHLAFTPPLNPDNLYGHLVATAVPGVEEWHDGAYRRTLALPAAPARAGLTPPAAPVCAPTRSCPR